MRSGVVGVLVLVLLGMVAGAAVFWTGRSGAGKVVASRPGLGEQLRSLGEADQRLSVQTAERLGLKAPAVPEIDLEAPREQDLLFLLDTFRSQTAGARSSAARALVRVQEPRAVGLLVRASGTEAEQSYYCAGALEILRFQTRELAAELMIDALEDGEKPVVESCRGLLEEKLQHVRGDAPDLMAELVESSSLRVQQYALRRLPPSDDPALRARVEGLGVSRDEVVAGLAQGWLKRAPTAGVGAPGVDASSPSAGGAAPSVEGAGEGKPVEGRPSPAGAGQGEVSREGGRAR